VFQHQQQEHGDDDKGVQEGLGKGPDHGIRGLQVDHRRADHARVHAADLIHEAAAGGAGIVIRGGVARAVMVKDESVIDGYPPFLQPAFRARRKLWQQAKIEDLLDGMDPMEFMLRFTISNPDMTTTIVGTANPAHMKANVKVAEKGPLPADLYAEVCKRFPKQAAEEVV